MTRDNPQAEFLARLGLEANPFQYTSADDEPRLGEYFVPPPYFASVLGDHHQPASCLVFAPRGSGKSAQRRMVELSSPQELVICITYDDFRADDGTTLVDSTISDHELNIARLTTVGLLTWLSGNSSRIKLLSG
ncbi:MAG TPA: hypothetical protein VFY10_00315, partial [Dehalococcoidia bacterium]|nr:hypothetical protein [Dehalococcoidia bacterium]